MTDLRQRPPITVECAGILARAKRRKDYCRVFVDFDTSQWYDAVLDDMSPGLHVERTGKLRFACANGSVMATNAYRTLWYHINGGLSAEQEIYGISFDWSSSGTMTWTVYEAEDMDSPSWASLGTGGGSSNPTPDSVSYDCSAGQYGLAFQVHYAAGKTLSADEYIDVANLRVYGQDGEVSIGSALTEIMVQTGLASSYSSLSVP